jgi:hypothetical protein
MFSVVLRSYFYGCNSGVSMKLAGTSWHTQIPLDERLREQWSCQLHDFPFALGPGWFRVGGFPAGHRDNGEAGLFMDDHYEINVA